MKTRIHPRQIAPYLRTLETPANRLARWQAIPLPKRLAFIRERQASNHRIRPCGGPDSPLTLAEARRQCLHEPAFNSRAKEYELGSMDGQGAVLWGVGWDHIERAMEAGDNASPLNHTGWYIDNYQGETYKPATVRLTEFPHLVFPAWEDPFNGGFNILIDHGEEIDFSGVEDDCDADEAIQEALRDRMHTADSIVESIAEEEREDRARQEAEMQAEECTETRRALATEFRELASEFRALRDDLAPDGAVCKTFRAKLRAIVVARETNYREARELREQIA